MKIVLLDRDGTLIVDPLSERVVSVSDIRLFDDTISALRLLAENGFEAILITNQAAIAEGLLNEAEFEAINNDVINHLAPSGIKILKTYMSPDASTVVNNWRKPGPGMLLKASEDFGFDLANVFMVGDRKSDVMAGINAGTRTILVKTANASVEASEAEYTAATLLDAAKYIVMSTN
jgi:D-glycero-D-manno-heptose 1,7-bisphosphate phosphatase